MVQRREDDAGTELDPFGRLRERRADDQERGHVPVVHEVMLGGPHRVEAQPFCLHGQTHGLVVRAGPIGLARPQLRAQESEAKSHGLRR